MAKTKTSVAVKERYNSKAYDDLRVRVPKGRKAHIQAAAEAAGESLNGYVVGAVEARMVTEGAMDETKEVTIP